MGAVKGAVCVLEYVCASVCPGVCVCVLECVWCWTVCACVCWGGRVERGEGIHLVENTCAAHAVPASLWS